MHLSKRGVLLTVGRGWVNGGSRKKSRHVLASWRVDHDAASVERDAGGKYPPSVLGRLGSGKTIFSVWLSRFLGLPPLILMPMSITGFNEMGICFFPFKKKDLPLHELFSCFFTFITYFAEVLKREWPNTMG